MLALTLRFYKIDAQSLWYDEGNSARIAERSLQLIIEGAAGDIHPPLYYIVLKAWRAVVGSSEMGLRSLSAVCGGVLVVFTYLMGRDLFNMPRGANTRGIHVGLIAAFLVAVAPFSIYYSQETRMYALLATLAAVSTWPLIRLARHGGWSWKLAVLYVLSTAAGLYTQYAYPFVMVAQGVCVLLAVLVLARARRWPMLIAYAVASAIALLIYAPWLPIAIRQITGWAVAPQDYVLGPAFLDALKTMIVGRTLPLDQAMLPMILFGIFALVSSFGHRREGNVDEFPRVPFGSAQGPASVQARSLSGAEGNTGDRSQLQPRELRITAVAGAIAALILALLPLLLLFVFKLYREAYLKFLLVCVAPLCLLAANGIVVAAEAVGRIFASSPTRQRIARTLVSIGCALALLLALRPSLDNLYNNPAYARDDYRSIAALINANARADDAVLFIAPNQWEIFTYYYPEVSKTFPLTYGPLNESAVDAELSQITAGKGRLFVLFYAEREADQNGWYERWLDAHAYRADQQWIGNIRLVTYAAPVATLENKAVQANFGGQVELISAATTLSKTNTVHEGDMLPLHLNWRALTKIFPRYKVFVHVGLPDAPPIAQNDSEPMQGTRSTDTWPTDQTFEDQRAVWIKPGTPPGTYTLSLGLYNPATGQRLKLPDGADRLNLADVVVGQ